MQAIQRKCHTHVKTGKQKVFILRTRWRWRHLGYW